MLRTETDRIAGSLAGRAAGSVYSHAADAEEGLPRRCVNGCPATSDAGIEASVLSVDSASRSGKPHELKALPEGCMLFYA